MTVDPADASLAWRIPRMEERLALRMAWVRWFLTLVVFSLAIVFVWPSETRLAAFAGGAPFLALLWWWLVYRRRQQMPREPNVWLDQNELRWQDDRGQIQRLARTSVMGFDLGSHEEGPIRLRLANGFLSQPLGVYAPISLAAAREFLERDWQLPVEPIAEQEESHGRELARLALYSEMHDEDRVWHLEGDAEALAGLATPLETAAQAALPPPGAMPLAQHVVTTRRDPGLVLLLVEQATMLGQETISAPPERMRDLAERLRRELSIRDAAADWSFDWPTDDGVWTIALHVK